MAPSAGIVCCRAAGGGVVHVPIVGANRAYQSLMLLPRIAQLSHATRAAYVAVKSPFSPVRPFHASAALRAIDMAKVDTTHRLAELRKLMKERNVDIYSRHLVHSGRTSN